jgi:hypothetical protein
MSRFRPLPTGILSPHIQKQRPRDRSLEQFLRGIRVWKDLEVVDVANLLARIDIDPDRIHAGFPCYKVDRRQG